jgi:hypothetical protein
VMLSEPDYSLMKKLYGVYDKLLTVARTASQANNGETKKGKSVSKAYTMPTTLASITFLRQLLHSLFRLARCIRSAVASVYLLLFINMSDVVIYVAVIVSNRMLSIFVSYSTDKYKYCMKKAIAVHWFNVNAVYFSVTVRCQHTKDCLDCARHQGLWSMCCLAWCSCCSRRLTMAGQTVLALPTETNCIMKYSRQLGEHCFRGDLSYLLLRVDM